jgi:hypothetical protein
MAGVKKRFSLLKPFLSRPLSKASLELLTVNLRRTIGKMERAAQGRQEMTNN